MKPMFFRFSVMAPTTKPMQPTMTKVKGAHRVQPESRSNRPMPMPPAIMPVRLPKRMAATKRGTLPRWTKPPLGAKGRRMFTTDVKTYTRTRQMAVMARDLTRDELLLVAAAELVLIEMGLLLVILFGRFNLPQSLAL